MKKFLLIFLSLTILNIKPTYKRQPTAFQILLQAKRHHETEVNALLQEKERKLAKAEFMRINTITTVNNYFITKRKEILESKKSTINSLIKKRDHAVWEATKKFYYQNEGRILSLSNIFDTKKENNSWEKELDHTTQEIENNTEKEIAVNTNLLDAEIKERKVCRRLQLELSKILYDNDCENIINECNESIAESKNNLEKQFEEAINNEQIT